MSGTGSLRRLLTKTNSFGSFKLKLSVLFNSSPFSSVLVTKVLNPHELGILLF